MPEQFISYNSQTNMTKPSTHTARHLSRVEELQCAASPYKWTTGLLQLENASVGSTPYTTRTFSFPVVH